MATPNYLKIAMKGVSTVIATLLMLIITIALAGLAYTYISGVFSARTAVVFDIIEATCPADYITVTVRNDGTSPSGQILVSATQPDGSSNGGSCNIASLNPGTSNSCDVNRPAAAAVGTYRIRVSASGATPASGNAYCATLGT